MFIPNVVQKTVVAAAIGYLYGKVFEVNASLTAKVFAVHQLARAIIIPLGFLALPACR